MIYSRTYIMYVMYNNNTFTNSKQVKLFFEYIKQFNL